MMSTQYNKITSPWHLNTCIFKNFPGTHLKARGIHDICQVVLIKYPIYNFHINKKIKLGRIYGVKISCEVKNFPKSS
jgi:hypothetical protein